MSWLNPSAWLDGLSGLNPGLIVFLLAVVVFLESAVLVGLLVPGESVVVLGGVLAAQGSVRLLPLAVGVVGSACVGNTAGYQVGRWLGHRLAGSRLERLVGADRIERAAELVRRRGPMANLLGRFVPVVGSAVPLLAGASGMRRRHFERWNLAGALVWAAVWVGAGYAGVSLLDLFGSFAAVGAASALAAVGALTGLVRRHRRRARTVPTAVRPPVPAIRPSLQGSRRG